MAVEQPTSHPIIAAIIVLSAVLVTAAVAAGVYKLSRSRRRHESFNDRSTLLKTFQESNAQTRVVRAAFDESLARGFKWSMEDQELLLAATALDEEVAAALGEEHQSLAAPDRTPSVSTDGKERHTKRRASRHSPVQIRERLRARGELDMQLYNLHARILARSVKILGSERKAARQD
jgi:hypothetical protein